MPVIFTTIYLLSQLSFLTTYHHKCLATDIESSDCRLAKMTESTRSFKPIYSFYPTQSQDLSLVANSTRGRK